ncbi:MULTISPECIES: MOSC domain-containing protein [unclassified Paludibacterium]|uniref:MOSC domain-containing protein n=1 Tax=unclassified Paludibacterium TaxID=2618429 RepID=UPI001C0432BA|nr:MOSC domain-containing protein [Paludibacterium sp. B53371]BEV72345.1 hypothetical protein THUN1379_18270 [Paludibacterium sp. THUN1379]
MRLANLFVHPLKSGRGIEYTRAFADQQGLLHDREWLLVDGSGAFMTARTHPAMVRIEIDLIPGAALFKTADRAPVLAMMTVYDEPVECQVWGDHFVAYHGDERVDAWFSDYLGEPCRLLWLGQQPTRSQKDQEAALSFADGYPYLLVNQSSLEALNGLLAKPVTVRHFRPNLLISGAAAYEEDDWLRIRIGEVLFEVTKPCSRCVLTTVDPDTGVKDEQNEPLKTLIRTRQLAEGICFGSNLRALNAGLIYVGDEVEVLESRYSF